MNNKIDKKKGKFNNAESSYDKSFEFTEEISPLLNELKKKCLVHGVPMITVFAIKNDNMGTEYANEMLSAMQVSRNLTDNKIAEIVKILNGFIAVPDDNPLEMDFEFDKS